MSERETSVHKFVSCSVYAIENWNKCDKEALSLTERGLALVKQANDWSKAATAWLDRSEILTTCAELPEEMCARAWLFVHGNGIPRS